MAAWGSPVVVAWGRVSVVTVAAAAAGSAVAAGDALPPRTVAVVAVALAAGLFLVAGVYRLARWRILGDAHSGLVGSALVVMGVLATPTRVVADLLTGPTGVLIGPASRAAASFVAMALVLRALSAATMSRAERPATLLPAVVVVVVGVFAGTMLLEGTTVAAASAGHQVLGVLLELTVAAGWAAVAVVAARSAAVHAWAGRVAPLLLGMAVAEVFRFAGHTAGDAWTLAGLLLTTVLAALATRSAVADLDRAIGATRSLRDHLHQQLDTVTTEVEGFHRWQSELRHDARNTCAGLRVAMTYFDDGTGRPRPEVAGRLRDAAVTELTHLERKLTTRCTPAAGEYDVHLTARAAVEPLLAHGVDVGVTGPPAVATGDSEDLALVLRELLLRTLDSAPGSSVRIEVSPGAGSVAVRYREQRPGSPPAVGTADLRTVRHLLRRQGGELVATADGVALTLPAPVPHDATPAAERLEVGA